MAQTSGRAQPARSRNIRALLRVESQWQGQLKLMRLVPTAHRLPLAIAATLKMFPPRLNVICRKGTGGMLLGEVTELCDVDRLCAAWREPRLPGFFIRGFAILFAFFLFAISATLREVFFWLGISRTTQKGASRRTLPCQ